MRWIFVLAPILLLVVIVTTVVIYRRFKGQRKLADEVKEERERGIMPQWGVKRSDNSLDSSRDESSVTAPMKRAPFTRTNKVKAETTPRNKSATRDA